MLVARDARPAYLRRDGKPSLVSGWSRGVAEAKDIRCGAALLVAATTAPVPIELRVARDARRVSGTPQASRLGYQPLLDWISQEEPGLLD